MQYFTFKFSLMPLLMLMLLGGAATSALELRQPLIIVNTGDPLQAKAAEFLAKEIGRRSAITAEIVAKPGIEDSRPGIFMDTVAQPLEGAGAPPEGLEVPEKAESFALWAKGGIVVIRGRDQRGMLFGAGRLLQLMEFSKAALQVPDDLHLATAPEYAIRTHQLGYRNTANTYDLWDLDTFDQYIRDLIIFGTNGIELIPPTEPGQADSPLMRTDMWKMTQALCDVISSYGIDVWMWSPVDEDLSKPEEAKLALERRKQLFQACSRIDDFFVPGGDDGDNLAQFLLPWLADLKKVLAETHPEARLWVSNQTFTDEENDYLFNLLASGNASFLEGVIYGPWTEMSLEEMRERTPKQFKLRTYPDITHLVRCGFPVPEWDPAFGHTLGREAICPRPHDISHIHNLYAPYTDGFGTYSDGSHDDFNKVMWSALGWDTKRPVNEITHAYAKVFFGDPAAEKGELALLGLEQNWRGPIAENKQISVTLKLWQDLWKAQDPARQPNWRLQMYWLRANYDAYVQTKAAHERKQEARANEILAGEGPAAKRIAKARALLAKNPIPPQAAKYRKRIEQLAPELRESIGYQLSIKEPYLASNAERGALLDSLDQPINNRLWLETQFKEIEKLPEAEQAARLAQLAAWEHPGEGSFYDDLGNLSRQPHLVRQKTWDEDPGGVASPMVEFSSPMDFKTLEVSPLRLSWLDQAKTLYGTPLLMHYEGLDPQAQYVLKVVYSGRYKPTMTLTADEQYKIHDALPQPDPIGPVEFDLPREATADGALDLRWDHLSGRGCQVGEVWLLRKP